MCGIVGAVSQRNVINILLDGLKKLEYRGYDSSGVAVLNKNKELSFYRKVGKVQELSNLVDNKNVDGGTGIAHTRWATHGEPSEKNAHPHLSNKVAVVHNGIIENYEELKHELISSGYDFKSETDTEVIAHLLDFYLNESKNLREAFFKTVKRLKGAYGTVAFELNNPEVLITARSGSPIVIGLGYDENFIASDQLALLNVTRKFMFLEEGDIAEIKYNEISVLDVNGKSIERDIVESNLKENAAVKGQYKHFMEKEIFEQPQAILDTLAGRTLDNAVLVESIHYDAKEILEKVEHVQIIACGTSFNSGLTAKYWFESIAKVSCDVEIASEFRYRDFVTRPNSLLITLSQSGETADTLAALKLAKEKGFMATMSICNVAGSSLVRESDFSFMTKAGVEIGVASTKAFTTQLVCLLLMVTAIGKVKCRINTEKEHEIISSLKKLPKQIQSIFNLDKDIAEISKDFSDKHHTLFLGRGEFYPIAIEAALKLKEISYIHAEAYAAGELKHGPLALIDEDMPVVVIAPTNEHFEKLKSNIEEVRARGGKLYVFTDTESTFTDEEKTKVIELPAVNHITAPIYFTVPMQLLSYHVALIKGTDVDQPRNLAKAVTVE